MYSSVADGVFAGATQSRIYIQRDEYQYRIRYGPRRHLRQKAGIHDNIYQYHNLKHPTIMPRI
jgi:hypothetical protein